MESGWKDRQWAVRLELTRACGYEYPQFMDPASVFNLVERMLLDLNEALYVGVHGVIGDRP